MESPNGHDRNQINHVAIRRRFRRLLLDVKVQQGAHTTSDYHLVRCKIRLKLARNRKKQKDPLHKQNFSKALKNCFEVLDREDPSMDDAMTWRDIYYSTAAETLGQRARMWKDWLSRPPGTASKKDRS